MLLAELSIRCILQVLTLFAGALLEKQIVVVCSNLVRLYIFATLAPSKVLQCIALFIKSDLFIL